MRVKGKMLHKGRIDSISDTAPLQTAVFS